MGRSIDVEEYGDVIKEGKKSNYIAALARSSACAAVRAHVYGSAAQPFSALARILRRRRLRGACSPAAFGVAKARLYVCQRQRQVKQWRIAAVLALGGCIAAYKSVIKCSWRMVRAKVCAGQPESSTQQC
jgi:hypothetical protein